MNYEEAKEKQFKLLYGGGQNWGKVNKAQFYNQLQQEIFAKKYKKPEPQKIEKAMENNFYEFKMLDMEIIANWWKNHEMNIPEWRPHLPRKEAKPIEDWE